MRTKNNFYFFVLVVTALVFCSFSNKKTKVLIIGDSISIGYTPFVKENLSSKAIVKHNPWNAQHTGTGLKKVKEWIGNEDWDIIQFNWGLWDLCYRHPDAKVYGNRDKVNGNVTFSLEEYEKNLEDIIRSIKQVSDAQLIFVTTSYVPKYEAGRFKKDAQKFNKVAKRVMKKYDIKVNDIYKKSKVIHKEFGKGDDDVHYSKEGYKKLAKILSEFLSEEIRKINTKQL
ncbi:SGNH/GDSL hydrolase family protein [Jejuia spongiicola]|uniref:SGNH/GDSL hydrolase family protein n=1 Tax=Jejuia spongiicola TaxID=2942207 RepID=A0ABT0QGN6_9FLAO|nr:SGNH/GDSL hydrolase family protein [Jejuia spongiicola]MCL6296151.1 SGNH/GDSL hydrolase family protein [Jejuia spongiicola]